MTREDEFIDAVKRGDTSTVVDLLRHHPELVRFESKHEKTGLHWAAEADQAEAARLLLDAGAVLEAKTSWGATPLEWAATMGSVRVADLLLQRGAKGLTLVVAAGLGKIQEVAAIIDSAANLSAHRRVPPPAADDGWPADSARIQGDVLSDAMYGRISRSRAATRSALSGHTNRPHSPNLFSLHEYYLDSTHTR